MHVESEEETHIKETETGDVFSASSSAVETWPKFFFRRIFGKPRQSLVNDVDKGYYDVPDKEVELAVTNPDANRV